MFGADATTRNDPAPAAVSTCSPIFQRTLNCARMAAASDAPVLIRGEAGSGRKTLALDLHRHSRRRNDPFRVYCGPLDPAWQDGSLYLPHLHALAPEDQVRLGRWLDGGDRPRLIASTDVDLSERVDTGAFSADLYFRLAVVPVELPPLRERREDLIPLLKSFSAELARHYGLSRPPGYSLATRNLLKRYRWPGNLRELRNLCERMILLHGSDSIEPPMLPPEFHPQDAPADGLPAFVLPEQGIDLTRVEGELIRQAIAMARGNRSRAARLLGISRDTLLYRIRKHQIAG